MCTCLPMSWFQYRMPRGTGRTVRTIVRRSACANESVHTTSGKRVRTMEEWCRHHREWWCRCGLRLPASMSPGLSLAPHLPRMGSSAARLC